MARRGTLANGGALTLCLPTCDPLLQECTLLCLEAGTPDCAAKSCCTSFCDTSEADASAACPGAAGGQECVRWYEPGQAPPGYEFAGACLIPE